MADPSRPRRPIVVVDDAAVYADVLAEVVGAGWTVVSSRQPLGPDQCAEWIVGCESDARGALLAAAAGAGVVVRVLMPPVRPVDSSWRDLVDDLGDDLASFGPVLRPDRRGVVRLDRFTWQLAHDLARGLTMDAAAARAHLSLRTAHRRVTQARDALGVGSRAQLVRALQSPRRVPAAVISR